MYLPYTDINLNYCIQKENASREWLPIECEPDAKDSCYFLESPRQYFSETFIREMKNSSTIQMFLSFVAEFYSNASLPWGRHWALCKYMYWRCFIPSQAYKIKAHFKQHPSLPGTELQSLLQHILENCRKLLPFLEFFSHSMKKLSCFAY